MVTVKDIADRVTDHSGEPRITAYTTAPTIPPNTRINEAIYEALKYLIQHIKIGGYVVKSYITTSDGTSSYSLAAGVQFEDIIQIRNNSNNTDIDMVRWEEYQDLTYGITTLPDSSLFLKVAPDIENLGKILLYPEPDGAYRVDYWYINIPALFTSSATTLNISRREESLLVQLALPWFDYLNGKISDTIKLQLMQNTLNSYKREVKGKVKESFPYHRSLPGCNG